MPVETSRPVEGAAVALAREPGESADLVDALLEVRTARERLRRVDSLLSRLLAEVQQRLEPQTCREPGNTPAARLPHSKTLDNAAKPDAGHALTRDAGTTPSVRGEVACR